MATSHFSHSCELGGKHTRYTSRSILPVCSGPKQKRPLGSLDARTRFDYFFFENSKKIERPEGSILPFFHQKS